jgi:hypothetical protein
MTWLTLVLPNASEFNSRLAMSSLRSCWPIIPFFATQVAIAWFMPTTVRITVFDEEHDVVVVDTESRMSLHNACAYKHPLASRAGYTQWVEYVSWQVKTRTPRP